MTEQGPVIAITFQVLQTMVVKNAEGKVIEGDPVGFFLVLNEYMIFICRTSP